MRKNVIALGRGSTNEVSPLSTQETAPKIKHLDLFSGIGGFSLALDNVYGKENIEHTFVEIDPFCQAIIKKHYPNSKIYGDIRTLTPDSYRYGLDGKNEIHPTKRGKQAQRLATRRCEYAVDLLTGGFPCQPFSQAGKRQGKNDDRYLWPEMLRVIREFKPTWVIGENVAGIIGMAQQNSGPLVEGETDSEEEADENADAEGILWGIIDDFEHLGYHVQPFVIPACAVGAPHRRDRIWIVAHNAASIGLGKKNEISARGNGIIGANRNAKNSLGERSRGMGKNGRQVLERRRAETETARPDSESRAFGVPKSPGQPSVYDRPWQGEYGGGSSGSDWLKVATAFCRVPNGLSPWLDIAFRRINFYDTSNEKDKREEVRMVQKALQSEKVRRAFGGLYEISDTEVLLKTLCRFSDGAWQERLPQASQEVEEDCLRKLWGDYEASESSRGRRHNEQLAGKHKDLLPQLSYETSLAIAEVWHRVRFAQKVYESEEVEKDGLELSKSQHRVERLKSLGNAIVPQVAEEIFRAIKAVDHEQNR